MNRKDEHGGLKQTQFQGAIVDDDELDRMPDEQAGAADVHARDLLTGR